MKIEVGKHYLTRDGRKIEIVSQPSYGLFTGWHVSGSVGSWWSDGSWSRLQRGPEDLIQECAPDGTPIATNRLENIEQQILKAERDKQMSRDECLAEFWMSLAKALSKAGGGLSAVNPQTTIGEFDGEMKCEICQSEATVKVLGLPLCNPCVKKIDKRIAELESFHIPEVEMVSESTKDDITSWIIKKLEEFAYEWDFHPDNGKSGYWVVKTACSTWFVKADNAAGAVSEVRMKSTLPLGAVFVSFFSETLPDCFCAEHQTK